MTPQSSAGAPRAAAPTDAALAALVQAMRSDSWCLTSPLLRDDPLPARVDAATMPVTVLRWQQQEGIAGTGYPLFYKGRPVLLVVRQWAGPPDESDMLARARRASPYWQHVLARLEEMWAQPVWQERLFQAFIDAELARQPPEMNLLRDIMRRHALPDVPSVRYYLMSSFNGNADPPLPYRQVLVTTLLRRRRGADLPRRPHVDRRRHGPARGASAHGRGDPAMTGSPTSCSLRSPVRGCRRERRSSCTQTGR
jgi:hypothetical protein